MNRNLKLSRQILLLVMGFSLILVSCSKQQKESSPNIIFYITDDISYNDIGCYGNDFVKTPHIDQMAAEGLAFENAYLTTSSCSPTRNSIITGRYPHNTGAPELHTDLPENQVMFPELMRNAGYYTVLSGKNHMGPVTQRAFDTISPGKGPGMQRDWVSLLENRPKDKPFFCWFASCDAHRPWETTEVAPVYHLDSIEVPPMLYDGPKTRKDLAHYYHEVSRVDHYLGEIRKELERQGVAGNTYIIFCSDNGRPFPRCKTRLYNSGIKTHLIVYGPKMKQGRSNSLVSVIDIAPTVLELTGIDKHERIQGISFTKILSDHDAKSRDFAFAEHNWHVYLSHERMVRFGDWIYIRNAFSDRRLFSMEAGPRFPAGEELLEAYRKSLTNEKQEDIYMNPLPEEELFHTERDPHQFNNLARDEQYQDTLEYLSGILDKWMEQTGDHVPDQPTPDRNDYMNEPLEDWPGYQIMPGERYGADTITHAGPVLK